MALVVAAWSHEQCATSGLLRDGTVGNVVSCTACLCPVQKQMLCDVRRMDAYYHAIMDNADCFKGKVVLDVGAGSGILAIW